jgi:hypothetical protein
LTRQRIRRLTIVTFDDFTPEPSPRWQHFVVGGGALEPTGSTLRFVTVGANAHQYANAQIDDYQGLPRRRFLWHPPLRLTVRARFCHPAAARLEGTAGFGFWNDPFLMTGARMPALPRAAWFFYASPPSNIKLDLPTPGWGWKAATIDAQRPISLLLALAGPAAMLLMNLRPLYRILWPPIQRAINVREALLSDALDMAEWHTYALDWRAERTCFSIDGERVLEAPSPRGPLGLVVWLDNQYLIATPWGRLRRGLLDIPNRQWMELDALSVEPAQGTRGED